MLPASDSLSELTALVPAPPGAVLARQDGRNKRVALAEARAVFESGKALVAHGAFVAGRLKTATPQALYDVLELFAFVRPGQPFVPSALGLARLLGFAVPQSPEDSAAVMFDIACALLEEAGAWPPEAKAKLAPLVATLTRAG